jgi:hypothetical protein
MMGRASQGCPFEALCDSVHTTPPQKTQQFVSSGPVYGGMGLAPRQLKSWKAQGSILSDCLTSLRHVLLFDA